MNGFTFYRSYYESIKALPEQYQLQAYQAIFNYMFSEEEPTELGVAAAIFLANKPILDKSRMASKSGSVEKKSIPDRIKSDEIVSGSNDIVSGTNEIGSDRTKSNQDRVKSNEKRIESFQDRTGTNADRMESNRERMKSNGEQDKDQDKDKDQDRDRDKDQDRDLGLKQKQESLCEKKTMCTREVNELFERLWKLYPNKRGKGQVSDARKKVIFGIGEEHMTRAVQRYVDEHEEKERSGKFTPRWQNGSTFFNSGYIDYLDENYSPAPREPNRIQRDQSARQQADAQPEVAYDENGRPWPVIGGIDWSKV
jgi:hypothetical protein